jgi:membrane-associated phospholipid phosphatase
MGSLPYIDTPVFLLLGQFAARSEAFDTFVSSFVNLDMFKGALIMAIVCWLWFDMRADLRERRTRVIQIILGAGVAGIASRLVQYALARPRPIGTAPEYVPLFGVVPEEVAVIHETSSFPSDHAALFAVVATGIFLAHRRWGYFAFAWTLLVIDLPRIYTGRHYPSDILAGVVLGICVVLAMHWPARLLTEPVLRLEKRFTPWFYGAAFFGLYELARLLDSVRLLVGMVLRSARIVLS